MWEVIRSLLVGIQISMQNLKQVVTLCFFKHEHPDALENIELSKAILFYSIVAMAIQINFHGALIAIIAICLEILLTLAFIGLLVLFNKSLEDFTPLACAVFVCSGFIGSIGVPFTLMLYIVKGKWALFLTYSIVALVIWNIMVTKYMFEKIIMISFPQSILLAVGYFLIAYAAPFLGLLVLL